MRWTPALPEHFRKESALTEGGYIPSSIEKFTWRGSVVAGLVEPGGPDFQILC